MLKSIEEQLVLHEGLRLKPYRDTVGKLTIGVGRNLDDVGITRAEAFFLLANDIEAVTGQLEKYGWYKLLDPVRQKAIVDMAFNLGLAGLLKFQRMITAIGCMDYGGAADEMLDSRWARQVGKRAQRLAEMMRTGADYID